MGSAALLAGLLGFGWITGAVSVAAADETPSWIGERRPKIDLRVEIPTAVTMGVALGANRFRLASDLRPSLETLPLDPSRIVLGLDRSVVGNDSRLADEISDALVITLAAAPLAFAIIDDVVVHATRDEGTPGTLARELAGDVVVLGEAFLLNTVLFEIFKTVVARPRPYTYLSDLGGQPLTDDALRSFYSGHSATAFTGAAALSTMMLLKHPEAPLGAKVAVFASSYVLAGTVAVLRVVAGRHFWTDVLVGSAVGITIGTIVPLLHSPLGFWR